MDQCQRRLILIRATARSCVVRSVQHAIGNNKIGGASRFESAEIARAGIGEQVVEPSGSRSKSEKVLACDDTVAAVCPSDLPGLKFACQRVGDQLLLAVVDVERPC